nr:MAG TPA: hypothetical protein [Bacteriophage sp.]
MRRVRPRKPDKRALEHSVRRHAYLCALSLLQESADT